MRNRKLLIGLLLSFFVILAATLVLRPLVQQLSEKSWLGSILSGWSGESVQTRFMSYATKISPLKRLEIAKLNQIEVFDRSSQPELFWHKLKLPEVVVRATVPVEYRYYVDLNEPWQVQMKKQVLTVIAPNLMPGTPSPDISNLKFEVRKGSLFRSETAVAIALKKELTSLLEKRALESATLVRETARQQIAELARQWLDSEMKAAQIIVQFADESANQP